MPAPVAMIAVFLRKSVDLEILTREGADDANACQVFLKSGGHEAFSFVGFFERSLHPAEKDDRECDDHGHQGRGAQGHLPIDPEEDWKADGDTRAGAGDIDHLLEVKRANGVNVTGAA